MPTTVRLVVLISGAGTNLQALIEASADPAYGATIVAVGSDRPDVEGLVRAQLHGIETFVLPTADFEDRVDWDIALTETVSSFEPGLVVLAGFMKLTGPAFLGVFGGRTVNTHPSLLPSFP
ncbi:MAG: phosphoribosylglycinamide formyltransferase, partial [Aeromicrobium sp.]